MLPNLHQGPQKLFTWGRECNLYRNTLLLSVKLRGGGASFLYAKKINHYFVNFVRPNGKFVRNTPTGEL